MSAPSATGRARAGKLSVPQMLRLMQLEVDRAQRHRYAVSCLLATPDALDGEEHDAERRRWMPLVFRQLKAVTYERDVRGLGFWTERIVLAVFPHVTPSAIQELGSALVERTRGVEEGGRSVTITAGVAHNQHSGPISFELLIREAEAGLVEGRRAGGDRCVQGVEVETEVDRLRKELAATLAVVDEREKAWAKEQDEIARTRARTLKERIHETFGREEPTEAVVRLEKEMIALALAEVEEWRKDASVRALADSRRQVEQLERRVRKLTEMLDVTEAELKRVAAMKNVDLGIASIYRTVQGLSADEENAEAKREMMKSIFEANMALLGREASES